MEIVRVRLCSEKTKACEKAPVEIIKFLREIKSNSKGKEIDVDKLKLEEIHVDPDNLKESHNLIFKNSADVFEKNHKSFFIGGDHGISYSVLRAFNKHEKNPLLIVFDSRGDCEDVIEGCCDEITNRNWIRKLIESGFSGNRVVIIGARNFNPDEKGFIKEKGISCINIEVLQEEMHEICDLIMERARNASGFYVSVDINCVDPGFAPGVYDCEPGGLSSRELIYFIKRLSILENFRGGDIVEINPEKDINGMTVKLGARILGEMM